MDKDKQKNKISKSDIGIAVILIIGILAVVNFFSYQVFYRWDLTQGNIYSLSETSKQTARELDDRVNIKAYFSDNLPSQVFSVRQRVADLLNEYRSYSNGNIDVEFVNPNEQEDLQEKLRILGIPQLTFEVYEKDKRQLVKGYMGVAVSYEDNTEVIPAIKRDVSDLEYQLTTAIKKVIAEDMATVGYATGFGIPGLGENTRNLVQELQGVYDIRQVDLAAEEPSIPQEMDTLVILGGTEEFSEAALREINSFVKGGGSLLAAQDGVTVREGLQASKNNTGLSDLLRSYGVRLNQDLVADPQSGRATFSQGFFSYSASYPYWPLIQSSGFASDYSAVANLENVVLPWVSSVEIIEAPERNRSVHKLMQTTEESWRVRDNFNITPDQASPRGKQQPYTIAVSVKGEMTDPYAEEGGDNTFTGRVVAVGDSDFASDQYTGGGDNLNLFLNLVDSLTLDDDLINIRSQGLSTRPIKELNETEKVAIRYLNVFVVTVAVVLYGLLRYYLRRRKKLADEF